MSKVKFGRGVIGVFLISIFVGMQLLATSASAQQAPSSSLLQPEGPVPLIQSIAVTGNQRIEGATIGSYLVLAPGIWLIRSFWILALKPFSIPDCFLTCLCPCSRATFC